MMRWTNWALVGIVAAILGVVLGVSKRWASAEQGMRLIDVNHAQVFHEGKWEELPMIPLSEDSCDYPEFKRYCD